MATRWKNLPGLVVIAAIGLLVTSCLTVELESEFAEDGSALYVYESTIDREAMAEFGDLADDEQTEAEFEEAAEVARAAGYDVVQIDTEELFGIRLSREYEDSEDVGRILNDLFTVGSAEPITAFSGSFNQDGNTHTLEVTVDGAALAGEDFSGEEVLSPAMIRGFLTLTYTVAMPGEIDEEATNGRILADGRVQWDLPVSETETFVAVSETEGNVASTLLLVGVIALLFLFIGGAALLALFLILRNRRAQPATTAYGVDPDAPTAPFPSATRDPNKPPAENF